MDPDFFYEVMNGLADTNFARGWGSATMYRDFLTWCEDSETADDIIAEFFPRMPSLVMDPEENLRIVSLRASVATELMKALLEAFENQRIEEFLAR